MRYQGTLETELRDRRLHISFDVSQDAKQEDKLEVRDIETGELVEPTATQQKTLLKRIWEANPRA